MKASCIAISLVFASLSQAISAQTVNAGSMDSKGQVLTKVVLTMAQPKSYGQPVTGLGFLIIGWDGDRIAVRTNEAGVASAWLSPGTYRLVTPDPFPWHGEAYVWDQTVFVRAGMQSIQLTQADAQSVVAVEDEATRRVTTPTVTIAQAAPARPFLPAEEAVRAVPPSVESIATQRSVREDMRSLPVTVDHPSRSGVWFNIGSGYGAISCAACYQSVSGYSGGLSLGGTVTPRLRLGVGTTGWYRSESGLTLAVGTLDARVRFYPSESSGFFITGGLGFGSISADLAGYGSATEFGAGAVTGLGWDLTIADGVSLTPFWNGFAVKTAHNDANVGQVGLGITFH